MPGTESQPPFFFLHVMKTGGTAFVFNLLQNFAPGEVYPSAVDKQEPGDLLPYVSISRLLAVSPERRQAIRMYTGHFPFVACELMGIELRTLTLLRDPVERSLSVLKHFKRHFPRYEPLSLAELYDDPFLFENFVHDHQTKLFSIGVADRPETFASTLTHAENRARHLGGPDPQRSTTITVDGDRLAVAKANLARVDLVGVNEHYESFVERLRARFGWSADGVETSARANAAMHAESADAGAPPHRRRHTDDVQPTSSRASLPLREDVVLLQVGVELGGDGLCEFDGEVGGIPFDDLVVDDGVADGQVGADGVVEVE